MFSYLYVHHHLPFSQLLFPELPVLLPLPLLFSMSSLLSLQRGQLLPLLLQAALLLLFNQGARSRGLSG